MCLLILQVYKAEIGPEHPGSYKRKKIKVHQREIYHDVLIPFLVSFLCAVCFFKFNFCYQGCIFV